MAGWTMFSVASAQELASTIQTPGIVSEPQTPATPITPYERLEWFTKESIAPTNLLGSAILAGWGTVFNDPHEYGTHWDGFGSRYGMVMSSVVTSNAMEASLGAIWGEDPRYRRASAGSSMRGRIGHVVKWTFVAPGRDGQLQPAWGPLHRFFPAPASSATRGVSRVTQVSMQGWGASALLFSVDWAAIHLMNSGPIPGVVFSIGRGTSNPPPSSINR